MNIIMILIICLIPFFAVLLGGKWFQWAMATWLFGTMYTFAANGIVPEIFAIFAVGWIFMV